MESANDRSIKLELFDDVTKPTILIDDHETYNEIIYGEDIPADVEEECLEIDDSPEICLDFDSEPMDRLLSPIPSSGLDSLKSPMHTISDCGYESPTSPLSLIDDDIFTFSSPQEGNWNSLFSLFPSLA